MAAPARAQTEPAPASPAPPAAAPEPIAPDEVLSGDPSAFRRQALFDLAFKALVEGDLLLAERAFAEAAALPGDAVMSAVADSFVERVQRLREQRRRAAEARRPPSRSRSASSGRTERIALFGTTTALGLGLWGWAFPTMVGIDPSESTRGFVGVYMLTSASAFILPYLVIGNEPVTPGQANLAFYGGTRGMFHGLLLGSLMGGELSSDRRARPWAATMLIGSIAEMAAGYHLARATAMTAGEARTMAALGDLGILMGFGTGFLLRLDGGPIQCPTDPNFSDPLCTTPIKSRDSQARSLSAAGLTGAALGLGAGYVLARNRDNTWGDGEVLRAATALGGWTGAGIADLAGTEIAFKNRPFTGLVLGGAIAGLVAGDRLVRKTSFTPGQSMLVDLSGLSGALLGAGTTYLIPAKGTRKPYIMASALGAIVGFGLAYRGFRDTPETATTARLSRLMDGGVTLVPTAGLEGERGLAFAGVF